MNGQQSVVFIGREGKSAKGPQWNDFMQSQRDLFDSYSLHGWKLVAAVGVHDATALEGVLLYFSKEQ